MNAKSALIATIGTVGIASAAMADEASNNTPGGWAASPGTGTYSTVISLPAVASIDAITVTFAHTWASDPTIHVIGPGGVDFNLWDEPGSGPGWYNNFGTSATNDLTVNLPAQYFWGATGINNDEYYDATPNPIPSGLANQIAAVSWVPGPLAAGDYTITIADTVLGDGANISGWSIIYTPIPAPGAFALLTLAGLVGGGRRRR